MDLRGGRFGANHPMQVLLVLRVRPAMSPVSYKPSFSDPLPTGILRAIALNRISKSSAENGGFPASCPFF